MLIEVAANHHDLGPNVTLLHEVVHAWQWFSDALSVGARQDNELATHGYWDAPHEVQAREFATLLDQAGVRVYFPEHAAPDSPAYRLSYGAMSGGAR